MSGPAGDAPLDAQASRDRLAGIAGQIAAAGGPRYTVEALAAAFIDVAVARMANAIRELALRHGEDPQRFALVPFGGAAGQHACAVAELLGIDTLLLHPLAGVLSAWGIGLAQRRCIRRRSVESPHDAAGMEAARTVLQQLADDARGELIRQRVAPGTVTERFMAHLRLAGSDTTLEIAWADEPGMRTAFREAHERLYGFAAGIQAVVIAAVSVEAAEHGAADLQFGSDDEEQIAVMELRRLRDIAIERALTLEETKKAEVFFKMMQQIKNQPKTIVVETKKMSTEELQL